MNLKREEREKFYKKMTSNKQRVDKYKRKYYNKPSLKRRLFLREVAYCPTKKNNFKC